MNMKGGIYSQDGVNREELYLNILSLIKQVRYKYLPSRISLKVGNGKQINISKYHKIKDINIKINI
jgi:hypothetical protein